MLAGTGGQKVLRWPRVADGIWENVLGRSRVEGEKVAKGQLRCLGKAGAGGQKVLRSPRVGDGIWENVLGRSQEEGAKVAKCQLRCLGKAGVGTEGQRSGTVFKEKQLGWRQGQWARVGDGV